MTKLFTSRHFIFSRAINYWLISKNRQEFVRSNGSTLSAEPYADNDRRVRASRDGSAYFAPTPGD
jgi:hypothetical protein